MRVSGCVRLPLVFPSLTICKRLNLSAGVMTMTQDLIIHAILIFKKSIYFFASTNVTFSILLSPFINLCLKKKKTHLQSVSKLPNPTPRANMMPSASGILTSWYILPDQAVKKRCLLWPNHPLSLSFSLLLGAEAWSCSSLSSRSISWGGTVLPCHRETIDCFHKIKWWTWKELEKWQAIWP